MSIKNSEQFEKIRLQLMQLAIKGVIKSTTPLKLFEYCLEASDWETGEFYHSMERISKNTGLGIRTILRAFDVLVKEGFIYKRRRGFKENNLYTIRFDRLEL